METQLGSNAIAMATGPTTIPPFSIGSLNQYVSAYLAGDFPQSVDKTLENVLV